MFFEVVKHRAAALPVCREANVEGDGFTRHASQSDNDIGTTAGYYAQRMLS